MINTILSIILGLIVTLLYDPRMMYTPALLLFCISYNMIQLCLFFINRIKYQKKFLSQSGKKKLDAYIKCGSFYPYLTFTIILLCRFSKNIPPLLILSVWAMFWALEYIMKEQIKNEISFLKKELKPDDIIIITRNSACLRPTNYFYHLTNNLFAYIFSSAIKQKFFNHRYQNYIGLNQITAMVCEKELDGHKKYLTGTAYQLIHFYSNKNKHVRRMDHPFEHTCDQILFYRYKNMENDTYSFPYSDNKVRFTTISDNVDMFAGLVAQLENSSSLDNEIYNMFYPLTANEYSEQGKQYACRLIKDMLNGTKNDTEYFYDLVKISEFIIHYKALADYQTTDSHYLDEPCDVPLGTLSEHTKDTILSECIKTKTYKEAIRYINILSLGYSTDFSKKRPYLSGNKCIVELRNRFIGHGTMTYSVSAELTQQLMIVVHALTHNFLLQPNDMMSEPKILNKWNKLRWIDDNLFLLSSIYDKDSACQYLDYASGQSVTAGNTLTITLNRQIKETLTCME